MKETNDIDQLTELFLKHQMQDILNEDQQTDILIAIQTEEITTEDDLEQRLSDISAQRRRLAGKQKAAAHNELLDRFNSDARKDLVAYEQQQEIIRSINAQQITSEEQLDEWLNVLQIETMANNLAVQESNAQRMRFHRPQKESNASKVKETSAALSERLFKQFPVEKLSQEQQTKIFVAIHQEEITTEAQLEEFFNLLLEENEFNKENQYVDPLLKMSLSDTEKEIELHVNDMLHEVSLKHVHILRDILSATDKQIDTLDDALDAKKLLCTFLSFNKTYQYIYDKFKSKYPECDEIHLSEKINDIASNTLHSVSFFQSEKLDTIEMAKIFLELTKYKPEMDQKKELIYQRYLVLEANRSDPSLSEEIEHISSVKY